MVVALLSKGLSTAPFFWDAFLLGAVSPGLASPTGTVNCTVIIDALQGPIDQRKRTRIVYVFNFRHPTGKEVRMCNYAAKYADQPFVFSGGKAKAKTDNNT